LPATLAPTPGPLRAARGARADLFGSLPAWPTHALNLASVLADGGAVVLRDLDTCYGDVGFLVQMRGPGVSQSLPTGSRRGMQVNSACAPNRNPVEPKTWSPTANSLTAAPAASTTPASSLPRIGCFGRRMPEIERLRSATARPLRRLASRVPQSARVTATAWILTRISSSLGTGRGTSSSRRTSGAPYVDDCFHITVA
jgi:hypothetical protein